MATSSSDGPIKISKRIEKELHQIKVVIRKLPPDLTEEKFQEALSDDVPSYSYYYFVAGDPNPGNFSFSRAYFAFIDEASIVPFRDKYDGLYLESENGLKYRAIVEFAPYQGIPKKTKRKPDARIGTIEQDPDYQAFLETCEVKIKPPSMADLSAYIDTIGTNKVSEVQKTPLIDFLLDSGHRRGGRSGKRVKSSASDSKKRHIKESSKPAKESRKDSGSSRASKEYRSKRDTPREGRDRDRDREGRDRDRDREGRDRDRDRPEKRKEEVATAKSTFEDRPSSSDRHKERGGRDKKKGAYYYEENGDVRPEEDRRSKVKNRERPDQVIYSPRGTGSPRGAGKHRGGGGGDRGESTRSKDREGSRHQSSIRESSAEFGRSGRRDYNEEKVRHGRGSSRDDIGSKERRYEREGGRRDDYRKSKDSYYSHDNAKTYSNREK